MSKTRREHLDWCIERAIAEMDYYKDPSKAYVSMASDLRKYPETNSETLISLCIMQPMMNPKPTRQEVINFLKGFN
jgi:hypothetical protein